MTIQPAERGPQLIAVYAFFCALTTVAVSLRTYCRAFLLKNFALDDYFAVTSWAFFVLLCAFAITGAYHGSGQHAVDIKPPSEIPVAMKGSLQKWWWRCEPIYVLSNMAIKGSIAVMLLRLTIVRTHRIIIWITIIITEVFSAFFFFLFIFQCQPSTYFWEQYTGGKGSCINPIILVRVTYVYSALMCAGDWTLAIIPFVLVWKLQMKPRTKVVVAMILAMGAIASTATIIRIPYLVSLTNKSDFLYATTDVAIWSCCETGLAITAASAATLRPLFQNFLSRGKLFGNTSVAHRPAQSLSLWPRPNPGQPRAGYVRRYSGAGPVINDGDLGVPTNKRDKRANTITTEMAHSDEEEGCQRTFLDSQQSSRSDMRMIGSRNHIANLMQKS